MLYMREVIPKSSGKFFKRYTQPCRFRKQKQSYDERLAQAMEEAVKKIAEQLKGGKK